MSKTIFDLKTFFNINFLNFHRVVSLSHFILIVMSMESLYGIINDKPNIPTSMLSSSNTPSNLSWFSNLKILLSSPHHRCHWFGRFPKLHSLLRLFWVTPSVASPSSLQTSFCSAYGPFSIAPVDPFSAKSHDLFSFTPTDAYPQLINEGVVLHLHTFLHYTRGLFSTTPHNLIFLLYPKTRLSNSPHNFLRSIPIDLCFMAPT